MRMAYAWDCPQRTAPIRVIPPERGLNHKLVEMLVGLNKCVNAQRAAAKKPPRGIIIRTGAMVCRSSSERHTRETRGADGSVTTEAVCRNEVNTLSDSDASRVRAVVGAIEARATAEIAGQLLETPPASGSVRAAIQDALSSMPPPRQEAPSRPEVQRLRLEDTKQEQEVPPRREPPPRPEVLDMSRDHNTVPLFASMHATRPW